MSKCRFLCWLIAQHCRCEQVLKHSEEVFLLELVKTKCEIHWTCLNQKHVDDNTETLWQALCAVCSQQVDSVRRLVNTSLVSPVDVIQSRHSHLFHLLSALCLLVFTCSVHLLFLMLQYKLSVFELSLNFSFLSFCHWSVTVIPPAK